MTAIRTTLNNPFQPGSGAVPDIWVGRDTELADVERRLVPRRQAGLFERGRTYLGDPGLGKSVLVNRIAAERDAAGDLVAAPNRLARGRDPLAALARAVAPLVPTGERAAASVRTALERVRAVGLLGASVDVSAPTEDRYQSAWDLVEAVSMVAHRDGRTFVVRVDEVQNLNGDGLSQLLTILGDLLERNVRVVGPGDVETTVYLPVLVLLSGLPVFARQAADAGATFSRRFATTYLEPFTDDEVRAGLAYAFDDGYEVLGDDGPGQVFLAESARERLVELCMGDPFLFQLAGAAAWDAATTGLVELAHVDDGWRRVHREVDAHVRSRLEGLTELQRRVLAAAADLGDGANGTEIARRIGRGASSDIGSTLQGLVDKHHLRLEGGGYRVVSRAVARALREG